MKKKNKFKDIKRAFIVVFHLHFYPTLVFSLRCTRVCKYQYYERFPFCWNYNLFYFLLEFFLIF